MNKNSALQYVLLRYINDDGVESDAPVAALILEEGVAPPRLSVFSRPNWDHGYRPCQSLRLAKAILREWLSTDSAEAVGIFQTACEFSNGPFRTYKIGTSKVDELNSLLALHLTLPY
jgi:hypothetical protein